MAEHQRHGKRWASAALWLLLSSIPVQARPDVPSGPPPTVAPATESKALGGSPAAPRAPGAGSRPSRPDTPNRGWISQTTVSLAGVLGVAVAAAAVVRLVARRQGGLRSSLGAGGRSPAGIMEILGRYPVGRGAVLVLLKLDRRVLLLSQTSLGKLGLGSSFATLCEITDPDEVASILVKTRDEEGESMAVKFRGLLSRFDRTMEETTGVPGSSRKVRTHAGGDRTEMWDSERADIPVVDLTTRPDDARVGGAAGSLRRRLAAIRWPSQEGGDRP